MISIGGAFGWWIGELARVLEPLAARHGRRAGFVLVESGGRYECWRISGRDATLLAAVPAGELATSDLAKKVRSRPVELRLDAAHVLDRTLSLPGASRQFLDAILRHQIERLTPWAADRVAFDYEIADAGDGSDEAQMRIRLVATAKETVARALAALEAAGLSAQAVGTAADPLDQASSIDLQDSSKTERRDALRRTVATGIAGFAAVAVLLGGFLSWQVYRLSGESGALSEAVDARRAVIAEAVARTASSADHQKLAARKARSLAMVLLLDELSRRIPQDTYLTELAVEGATVRINGLSAQAPELIAVIESSPMLSGAQFAAPTTRAEDGLADSFQIVARVIAGAEEGSGP